MITHIISRNIIIFSRTTKHLISVTKSKFNSTENADYYSTFSKELKSRLAELEVESLKSSGPGGQNVNKRNTKIRLKFNIGECSWLSEQAKLKLERQEGNRINKEGVLILECQEYRTKEQNHDKVLKILKNMLELANETQDTLSRKTISKLKQRKNYLRSKARSARKHKLIAERKKEEKITDTSERPD
ncbi:hypothetical protein LOD99_2422 [Oopsacas minuta]|uniref:Large ribosomal subunit protein mL62 n=1 Tax=Oopsacas minuta TaxID=111878 RepID=A0AAV7K2H2_9METZ|nr:hypothetical protein LOD99_2422 [Oopsacas minuta]